MLGLACRMMFYAKRFGCFAGSAAGAILLAAPLVLMTGCASPGPPRAPSLRLPQRVKNLSVARRGNVVVVRFATPERTSDNGPLTAPVTASLCRAVANEPCRPTGSFPGKTTIAGPVEWTDVLPPELATGALQQLTYRVELFNPRGRSAGPSEPAFAAAGDAPRPVEGLRADGSHAGVALRWTAEAQPTGEVLVKREDLNPAPRKPESTKKAAATPKGVGKRKKHGEAAKPAAAPAEAPQSDAVVWLHAVDGTGEHDSGGIVDTAAKADEPYRYTAIRRSNVTLDGRKLELRSEASEAVAMTLRDIFPPTVPQGLLAAGFPVEGADNVAVDLVWQPNTEADLAGYNVFRQSLDADGSPSGPAVKLTAKPMTLPAFHDATAAHGVSYRYTVTAVDAKGNESAASAPADLAATP
jgi:hypothetical protein